MTQDWEFFSNKLSPPAC